MSRSAINSSAARITLIVLLAACMAPTPIAACGPFFNDAHHGQDEDLLVCRSLEAFYAEMCWPEIRGARGHEVVRDLAQREGRPEERPALIQALRDLLRDRPDLTDVRLVRDRLELLPLVGSAIPEEAWQRYVAALPLTGPTAAGMQALSALSASLPDEPAHRLMRTAIAVRLAAAALRDADPARAAEQIALAEAGGDGPKRDELDYLRAIAPACAGLATPDRRVSDPHAALMAIATWISAHSGSPRIVHARGWQAFVLYNHREVAWEGDVDGLHAAIRIWQAQVVDPTVHEGFYEAVGSLRLAYRRVRSAPMPGWMVADPRHALAIVWHAVTDRQNDVANKAAVMTAMPASLLAGAAGGLDASLVRLLAETWVRAGRPDTGLALARQAVAAGSAEARLLAARLLARAGDPVAGAEILRGAPAGDAYRDVVIALGGAFEQQRLWERALGAYLEAGSTMDLFLLSDGEMPLDELLRLVSAAAALPTGADENPWMWGNEERHAGYDWRPELGRRLARRLIRHGRTAEALPFLTPAQRAQAERLIALEADLAQSRTPEHLLALADWWYREGPRLVVNDRHWQQWAYYRSQWAGKPASDALPPVVDPERIGAEIEAMTVYRRAGPLYREVADQFADHPEAARALYHAALCTYWPCGSMPVLRSCPYWGDRARREGFFAQGDELMRLVASRYPGNALARDAKVLAAIARQPAP